MQADYCCTFPGRWSPANDFNMLLWYNTSFFQGVKFQSSQAPSPQLLMIKSKAYDKLCFRRYWWLRLTDAIGLRLRSVSQCPSISIKGTPTNIEDKTGLGGGMASLQYPGLTQTNTKSLRRGEHQTLVSATREEAKTKADASTDKWKWPRTTSQRRKTPAMKKHFAGSQR